MLRTLTAAAAVVAALATPVAVSASSPSDGVWVNGARHVLVTGPPASATTHPTPLYVIAPVNATAPLHALPDARTHGFGAHDHVIASSGTRTCELELVVPGPKAKVGTNVAARMTLTPSGRKPLLYAARLGGRLEPLTWAARIRSADAQGLARIVDTHVELGCTVR